MRAVNLVHRVRGEGLMVLALPQSHLGHPGVLGSSPPRMLPVKGTGLGERCSTALSSAGLCCKGKQGLTAVFHYRMHPKSTQQCHQPRGDPSECSLCLMA